jgi:hypothetical protein
MTRRTLALLCLLKPSLLPAADTSLTIYNQNFAVVREILPLELKAGDNTIHFAGATAMVAPDSVILRDPKGQQKLQILEQNYRADTISQGLLLSLYEGKAIDFFVCDRKIPGKIIRSGYNPGTPYGGFQPVIEVNGQLQFQLPGTPVFPALTTDSILKPRLDWVIHSTSAAKLDAELSYVSGGLLWSADYNLAPPEAGDKVDLTGWVTLQNQCGHQFDAARIKLVAGDVNKVQPATRATGYYGGAGLAMADTTANPFVITQRNFDEYHLYTLPRPTTIRDRETKQVEFLRAAEIPTERIYVYDGASPKYNTVFNLEANNNQYGTQSNPNVWVIRQFRNSEANHLGLPLPAGRVRFYRRDQDGQMQFTGENQIIHTPKDEMIRLYTGNAFDLRGERKQTNFQTRSREADETFEIKVRNHKRENVTIRVVEHLYRWSNWSIAENSHPFGKTDSQTIEFEVLLRPDEERNLTYRVHYSW